MNIDLLRHLDRFMGIPFCWLTGLVLRVRRRAHRPVRNILVIKLFGMGSIVLATPALQLLRASFPDARITVLTFRANHALAERLAPVDAVLSIDPRNFATLGWDVLAVARRFRVARFDLVFDLEFFSKFSTLVAAWSGAPRRVGFALPTRWRTMLVTDPVSLTKERHVAHAFAAQVQRVVGGYDLPAVINPSITDDDLRELEILVPRGAAREIVINVNAGTTFLERRWPAERFIELVDALSQRDGASFLFIGTGAERAYTQSVIDRCAQPERCANIAGMLTVPHVAALVKRAAMVISNDSGPLHLAAVSGTPTVALYGPETPSFYGPIGARVAVVYVDVACSPCMNIYNAKFFRCPYNARCMRDMQVSHVLRAIDSLEAA